tara:strand:- start:250 stop:1725 length:1476 start_codon:yes stop_codon:yes gene_type:complete
MFMSNFTLKFLTFFSLFTGLSLFAEPFLAPHDSFLRHEIRLLQDQGFLDSTLNSWPLNLGGLSYEMDNNSKYDLFDRTIKRERQSGWSPINYTVGFSDDRVTSRSFGNEPRSRFTTGLERSWMNDFFAAKLSLHALYGVEDDWKGRKEDGLALDGSYIAARFGNWSASLGKVDRWWGPGWDGSLILSHNARPIPAISIDRRISDPFETKWLSWIGPWSFHSFIGQMEEERTVPNPYIWGMRGDVKPAILGGLEIGFFRIMQLGGDGRPEGFSTWVDAFLSQDNTGANTGKDRAKEPGNQLAGIDIRWQPFDSNFAIYGQLAGDDEDKFLPNCLMFQYGIEAWRDLKGSTLRVFAEYADLTSYWWTDDPRTRNISYGHHIYRDGYRYIGRPIGHWSDQDSQILSVGGFLQKEDDIGWGAIVRTGSLNEDGGGQSSVSEGVATDYFSVDLFNSREYPNYNLSVNTSIGWESLAKVGGRQNDGLSAFLSLTRTY